MSKVKIEFIAATQKALDVATKPYPAKNAIPNWYKEMSAYIGGVQRVNQFNDPNSTIKKCMPVFDIMTAGYYIPLHTDIYVENINGNKLSFRWSWGGGEVVTAHPLEQHNLYPIPKGYKNTVYKFISPWTIKTPKGWSCLFVHPNHYDELPFKTFSAMVDTDKHPTPIHFPFVIKEDFQGLISKDTPIIQVIPFKREDFISEYSFDNGNYRNLWDKAHTVFFDRYKRFFRTPKSYEEGEIKVSKCPFHW